MNDRQQDDQRRKHGDVEYVKPQQRRFSHAVSAQQQFTDLSADQR